MNLLPKDTVFFDHLDGQTKLAIESIQLLQAVLAAISAPAGESDKQKQAPLTDLMIRCHATKKEARHLFDTLSRALCETFITPYDREDLHQLASGLYKIPKLSEKTIERLFISMSSQFIAPLDDELTRFAALLGQGALSLKSLMAMLEGGAQKITSELSDVVNSLDAVESDADSLFGELLTKLYDSHNDMPYQEFFLRREVYGMLEKMTDIYRDLGQLSLRLILKHA
ncbi:MAG: DUF47 family protein [Vampirovibrionales bacterium]|nr:DUF47 family protein [Vampirovibrionales bacterium]